MSNTVVAKSGGIGFFGLLTVAFVVLKLTGFITWSWLWVLSPIWIPVTLSLLIVAFIVGTAGVIGLLNRNKK